MSESIFKHFLIPLLKHFGVENAGVNLREFIEYFELFMTKI